MRWTPEKGLTVLGLIFAEEGQRHSYTWLPIALSLVLSLLVEG